MCVLRLMLAGHEHPQQQVRSLPEVAEMLLL